MTIDSPALYTTNLSKAQGIVPETLELLELWEPGMTAAELKNHVLEIGALNKATELRVSDVVSRGFAQRYLRDDGRVASWLKRLLANGASRKALSQICLIYTCRANTVLHDFIREVFWAKYSAGAPELTKADALQFLDRAANLGRMEKRWSETMMVRVSTYLFGSLEDFGFIHANRRGRRQLQPPRIDPLTTDYLAQELHFSGAADNEIAESLDWGLFGLYSEDAKRELEASAGRGHFLIQDAGEFIRIEWQYESMEEAIDAITS